MPNTEQNVSKKEAAGVRKLDIRQLKDYDRIPSRFGEELKKIRQWKDESANSLVLVG